MTPPRKIFLISLVGLMSFTGSAQTVLENNRVIIKKILKLDIINSPFRETNLSLTPDGKYLFFLSGRGGMPWSDPDYTTYRGQVESDGDIYFSKRINGIWTEPYCLGPQVNTDMGEDEPNVSPDGQFVVFQSWRDGWEKEGGPYYVSELSGEVWGKPVPLGGGIHRFFVDRIEQNDGMYATDGSALTPDGKVFVFAGGRLYDDPMDLFICYQKNGAWTYPEKMPLSTSGDERSVYIAGDGKTLFFSSTGYPGYGGLDIFKTTLALDHTAGTILNIGEPFNSKGDDYCFSMNFSGTEIYYIQEADIFQMDIDDPSDLIKPGPAIMIQGIVTDYNGQPVESFIRIIRKENKQLAGKAKSNAMSGEYSLVFPKIRGTYLKEVIADKFRPNREEWIITEDGPDLRKDHVILLKEKTEMILFQHNEYQIIQTELLKLDSVAEYLARNNKLHLHLSGHADQSGPDLYNLELSKKRVEEVKNYLLSKGIPEPAITCDYYGEKKPLISPELLNKIYLNRRVELEIIE